MKYPLLVTCLCLLLASSMVAAAQTEIEKRTVLQNYMDWESTVKEGSDKKPFNIRWKVRLLSEKEKVMVVPDFGSPEILIGLMKKDSAKLAEAGISGCSSSNGCELTSTTPSTLNWHGKSLNVYDGKIKIRLYKNQEINEEDKHMAKVKFYTNKNTTAPYVSGYGTLGLSPKSEFYNYIKEAFKWVDNSIIMKFWMNPLNNKADVDWNSQDYFDGTQLTFNPPMEKVNKVEKTWYPATFGTNGDRWGLTISSISLGTNTLASTSVCFYPNSAYAFYFNSKTEYDKLAAQVFTALCGKTTGCPTKTTWNGLKNIELKISDSKTISISPATFIWDNTKEIKLAFGYDSNIFSNSATAKCNGYSFALGGAFFSRHSIYFKIPADKKAMEATWIITAQTDQDPRPPIYSIFFYFWIGGISLLLYACVWNHIFRGRTPEVYGKKGDDAEGNFQNYEAADDDDEIMGYIK